MRRALEGQEWNRPHVLTYGPVMASKRERVDTGSEKRYLRRDVRGRFTPDQENVGRASAADQQRDAKTPAKRGQGVRGDRPDSSI